ncbi:HAMP domain-containing sensor histidine kinase, partial [Sphingobium sp.]|uniref:sensor histidine kinase n=1 Tax=Sphingobium sp. TaxID=1912891 RepID=UPI002BD96B9C
RPVPLLRTQIDGDHCGAFFRSLLRQYFRVFELSAAIASVCESYTAVAEDSDKSLTCGIDPEIRVLGDVELVSQALVNLLENAIRYTPPRSSIRVRLCLNGTKAVLSVTDDGHGVPEDRQELLKQRFTRGDRSRGSQGYGLGLNLVEAVARVHGGCLRLSDARPGLRAEIELPLPASS